MLTSALNGVLASSFTFQITLGQTAASPRPRAARREHLGESAIAEITAAINKTAFANDFTVYQDPVTENTGVVVVAGFITENDVYYIGWANVQIPYTNVD